VALIAQSSDSADHRQLKKGPILERWWLFNLQLLLKSFSCRFSFQLVCLQNHSIEPKYRHLCRIGPFKELQMRPFGEIREKQQRHWIITVILPNFFRTRISTVPKRTVPYFCRSDSVRYGHSLEKKKYCSVRLRFVTGTEKIRKFIFEF
jgi:hypothetical protein